MAPAPNQAAAVKPDHDRQPPVCGRCGRPDVQVKTILIDRRHRSSHVRGNA